MTALNGRFTRAQTLIQNGTYDEAENSGTADIFVKLSSQGCVFIIIKLSSR